MEPERETVDGDEAALLTMVSVAVCAPGLVGAKVTLMVQRAFTATAVQLLVWVKLAATALGMETEETVSGAVPELVTVTGMAMEVEPTGRAGKVSEAGERLTAGAPMPVPVTTSSPTFPEVRSIS